MKKVKESAMLFLCGISIGWLSGLSISPVISIILTSLISLLASVAAISVGLESLNNLVLSKKINSILPITLLILGISIGAPAGIYARTNDFFGENPKHLFNILVETGISKDSSKKYIMDYEINRLKLESKSPNQKDDPTHRPGLYNDTSTLCAVIFRLHGNSLRKFLGQLGNDKIKQSLTQCRDSLSLENFKRTICK
jgi:hypothetical protein